MYHTAANCAPQGAGRAVTVTGGMAGEEPCQVGGKMSVFTGKRKTPTDMRLTPNMTVVYARAITLPNSRAHYLSWGV